MRSCHRTAECREEPHRLHRKVRRGCLPSARREIKRFVQVSGQRCECGVVRKPLEKLGDVRDPERPLKASADVIPSASQSSKCSPLVCSWTPAARKHAHLFRRHACTRITLFRLVSPAAMVTDERRTFKNSAKKLHAGRVGAAIDGWRGEREFQCVAHLARDRILLRPGMNVDRECYASGSAR